MLSLLKRFLEVCLSDEPRARLRHRFAERVVFRAMKEDEDHQPVRGPSARTLGARLGIDIPADENGHVEPGTGGMSVAPGGYWNVPRHRLPHTHGGTGKDYLFGLNLDVLPETLVYRPDPDNPDRHGFIEPSFRMPFGEYERQLENTWLLWRNMLQRGPGSGEMA